MTEQEQVETTHWKCCAHFVPIGEVCGYCATRSGDEWLCPDCPPDGASGGDGG